MIIKYKGRVWQKSKESGLYYTHLDLSKPKATRLLEAWVDCKEFVPDSGKSIEEIEGDHQDVWNEFQGMMYDFNIQFDGELFDVIFQKKLAASTIIRFLVTKVRFDN